MINWLLFWRKRTVSTKSIFDRFTEELVQQAQEQEIEMGVQEELEEAAKKAKEHAQSESTTARRTIVNIEAMLARGSND